MSSGHAPLAVSAFGVDVRFVSASEGRVTINRRIAALPTRAETYLDLTNHEARSEQPVEHVLERVLDVTDFVREFVREIFRFRLQAFDLRGDLGDRRFRALVDRFDLRLHAIVLRLRARL